MYGDYVRNIFWSTRMQINWRPNHSPHNFFKLFHHHPKSSLLGPARSLICKMTSSITSKTGWIKWLDEHNTSATYDAHSDKVAKNL